MKTAPLRTTESPRIQAPPVKSGEGVKVEKAVTVRCLTSQAYSFWRSLENLPRFMEHLVSVTSTSEVDSHWVAQTPKGERIEWDARLIEDKPDELIAWESLPGSDIDSAGSVRFSRAPGNRGTVVKVALKYAPARGRISRLFAKFYTTNARREIARDLFHFKSLVETGEIPTVQGQPRGGQNTETCV